MLKHVKAEKEENRQENTDQHKTGKNYETIKTVINTAVSNCQPHSQQNSLFLTHITKYISQRHST